MKWFFFFIDDALEANELVTAVFEKYRQLIIKNRSKNSSSLISTPSATVSSQNGTNKNTMDELNEIFASSSSNSNISHSNTKPTMTLTPLEPMQASAKVNTNGNFVFSTFFVMVLRLWSSNLNISRFQHQKIFQVKRCKLLKIWTMHQALWIRYIHRCHHRRHGIQLAHLKISWTTEGMMIEIEPYYEQENLLKFPIFDLTVMPQHQSQLQEQLQFPIQLWQP